MQTIDEKELTTALIKLSNLPKTVSLSNAAAECLKQLGYMYASTHT
jgi:hypothetical protein